MKKIYTVIACLGLLAFPGCQEDEELSLNNVGYLRLEVGTDNTTLTKAEEAEYNPKQIAVKIIDETGLTVKETDDYTTWTEAIPLSPGKYKISASSAGFDGSTAAVDKPYYAGLDSVTVEAGKPVSKTVTCTLANVLVTVEFNEAFKAAFKSATVVVRDTVVASNQVSFKMNDATETQKAYFPVTGLFADLAVTNQKDVSHEKQDTVRDVKAQENVILRYQLGEPGNGSTDIDIELDGTTRTYIYTIGVPLTETTTLVASEANAWSKFAYLNGEIASFAGIFNQSNLSFQYKTADAEEWTSVSADLTEEEKDKKYSVKLSGLNPNTKYQYRLYYKNGEEEFTSDPKDFTTEAQTALKYADFNEWYQNQKAWYAIPEAEATSFDNHKEYLNSFWDSGNMGAATMRKNPTEEATGTEAHNGSSVKMSSQFVGLFGVGKFAAGNIYTGHYYETIMSPMGAKIFFGQSFTSRPTQLKGWYKYTRGTEIDEGDDPYKSELTKSGGDQCAIYIALADNVGLDGGGQNYAFQIDNTLSADEPDNFKYKNTIDFSEDNKNIVAYGTITEDEAKGTNGQWKEFTIDLEYRDLTRVPKYIIVVASASKYGDFFTGSTSSVMYIDDFELVYGDEPAIWEQ